MMRSSRRMTLSRVFELPRMLMRSNVTRSPFWISKTTSTVRVFSLTGVVGEALT
jgi:hypothetical protein